MNKWFIITGALICCVINYFSVAAQNNKPVNKHASPEATALLKRLYSLSGRYLLSGQHNYPNDKDRETKIAAEYIGKTPVIFSTDMGFAKAGDHDSYLARPEVMKECIRQHQLGAVVTICWHAVPPTADEPVTFQAMEGANPDKLHSVSGRLTDQQFDEILTPGTALYKQWAKQVDSVAKYLKQLRDAQVPVLWRPYHEMNGDWFWWGGRPGPRGGQQLYRQLFERLTTVHQLNNLVWVWNVDRPSNPGRQFSLYYPGDTFVDVCSIDIYENDYNPIYYDSLLRIAKTKPIALGEVDGPPAIAIWKNQPRWTYYVVWAGRVKNVSREQYYGLKKTGSILFLEDLPFKFTNK